MTAHYDRALTEAEIDEFERLLQGNVLVLRLVDDDPIRIVARPADPQRREINVRAALELAEAWRSLRGAFGDLAPAELLFDGFPLP